MTTSCASMDLARDVCSSTLSVRKAHQRRVRLPLQSLTIASPDAERLAEFTDLIADEVNVRSVELTTDVGSVATDELKLVPAKLGPRLGKDVQLVIKAHKSGDWTVDGDVVTVGGVVLEVGEYSIEQVASDDQASTGTRSARRRRRARYHRHRRARDRRAGTRSHPFDPAGSTGCRPRRVGSDRTGRERRPGGRRGASGPSRAGCRRDPCDGGSDR